MAPGRSVSGWPIDPRDYALNLLLSALASAVVIATADAGSTANPEPCRLRSPRPPVALVAIAPLSPSRISSNHLSIGEIILLDNPPEYDGIYYAFVIFL